MSSVETRTPLRDCEARISHGPDYVAVSFWRPKAKETQLDHQFSCSAAHARRFAEAILRAVEKVGKP